MKRTILSLTLLTVFILSVSMASMAPAMAGSGNNVGRHAYKINIIGRPNTWQGSDTGSSSKTIFISIKTEPLATCDPKSGVSGTPTPVATLPTQGQRIYFYTNTENTFDVEDRDATDGIAIVSIPQTANGYDIYVRILGGSNNKFPGCLDADAYAYLTTTETWYLIGHLDANRKPGVPEKFSVRSLFYSDGVAYFSDPWQDYFWNVYNNGLRNMQLIFYEL